MTSSPPSPDLVPRWHHAASVLGVAVDPEAELRGEVVGRTVGGPVSFKGVPAWLRLNSAPRPGGKRWEGPGLTDVLLDEVIPRPAPLGEHSWTEESPEQAFQAQLWERLKGQALSESPYLTAPVPVSDRWWRELRNGVDRLRETPTSLGRQVMTQEFIDRIPRFIPELAGRDLTVPKWETAHGDLHWANLTSDPLEIIDWEGWVLAPAGYDAAVLHAYAIPRPEAAEKVHTAFADLLNTPSGRLAELVIAAEIIQAAERDTVHKRLEPDVRQHLTNLLDRHH